MIENARKAIENYINSGNLVDLESTYQGMLKQLSETDGLQMNVSDLLDLALYCKLIEDIIKFQYDRSNAELNYLIIDVLMLRGMMINSMETAHNVFRTKLNIQKAGKLCYFDQNVMSSFLHGELPEQIVLPEDGVIVYSPAHIEEISNSPKEMHQDELRLLSEKTQNLEIIIVDNELSLVEEKPIWPYKRINDDNDRALAQRESLLQDRINEILMGNLRNNKSREIYNSQQPENFLRNHADLVDDALMRLGKSYKLKDVMQFEGFEYGKLNAYIHDLHHVMDIYGFKKDNSERRIQSARLDKEHLLYASYCDVFYTKDEKLRYRAMNIFDVLGKQIECPKC